MKKIVFIIATICFQFSLWAQLATYKIPVLPTDKKLEISCGASLLTIESHDGNDVIISSKFNKEDLPEEAEGLKPIVGGSIDNTNTGANVNRVGQVIKVKIPKTSMYTNFNVKVPKNLNTKVKEFANQYSTWNISGLSGEVEAKTSFSSINITDATGPLLIHSDWGKVKVNYTKVAPDKPNSLYSNGGLDVTLPADCKANLNLLSSFGNVYTDFDIVQKVKTEENDSNDEDDDEDANDNYNNNLPAKIDSEKVNKDEISDKDKKESYTFESNEAFKRDGLDVKVKFKASNLSGANTKELLKKGVWVGDAKENLSRNVSISNDCNCDNESSTIGTINGGGVNITLRSDHSNIYLRKKK